MLDQGELPQVRFPLPKQHRWPSVMRRLRVRGWWQKIHGSGSKSVKSTWIEAWSLADRILLEALHFLQITSSCEICSSSFTCEKDQNIANRLQYSMHSPGDVHVDIFSSFVLHGASWVFFSAKKMRSNFVKTCNFKHRVSQV